MHSGSDDDLLQLRHEAAARAEKGDGGAEKGKKGATPCAGDHQDGHYHLRSVW
jgi:hypothetical protein